MLARQREGDDSHDQQAPDRVTRAFGHSENACGADDRVEAPDRAEFGVERVEPEGRDRVRHHHEEDKAVQ